MMNLISLFVVISAVSLFVVISGVWCYPEFQCPSLPHWNLRAGVVCNHTTDYRCLWDRNNEYHIEQCGGREYQKEGYRRIFSGGLDSTKCSSDRYQPFRYTTEGNFDCVFKKSTCTDLGQVVYGNGDRISDRRCACDYYNGYVFTIPPKHHCYCEPDREDCSCVFKTCPDDHIIDPDHECRHIRNWLISFRCKKLAEPDRNPVTLSPIDLDQDKSEGPRTSESSSLAALVVSVIIGIVILTGIVLFLRVYMKEREEERKQNEQKIQQISTQLKDTLEKKEDSVPKHIKEKHSLSIKGWEKDLETFTVTRATKYVAELIKENSIVLVAGSSGSGKSSIIHHVALELQTIEKYDVIPILTGPDDIIKYRDIKKNQVFVIDDICGKNFINEQVLQIWKEQTDKIKELLPSEKPNKEELKKVDKEGHNGSMKILVSCRLHITKDEKFKSLKIFTEHMCDIQSEEHCLLPQEREQMIKKYTSLTDFELQKLEKKLDKCYFFPLLCKMSKGKQGKQLTELFSSPIDSIKNDIKDMIKTKEFEYFALVLCVLFQDGFDEKYIRTPPQDIKQKIDNIVSNFDIDLQSERKREQLLETFNRLDGTYIKKAGSVISISHDKLFDMIAATCGQQLRELFIEFASASIIAEQFRFCSIFPNQDQDESLLYLSEESENLYFRRIFLDLKKNDLKSLFYNQQLKETRYKDKVMGYINQNSDYCKQLFLYLDVSLMYYVKYYDSRYPYLYRSTPLIEACKIGFYDLAEYLISIECNLNKKGTYCRSPLYYSCRNGFVNIVELLITNGVNTVDALYYACDHGDIDIVKMLLDRKVDPSQCFSVSGKTPLYVACSGGYTEIVELLLDRKVDPSQCFSVSGWTPLYVACYYGHTEIVELLLDRKVDPSQCCRWSRRTPLYAACEFGRTEIVKMLLDRKVDVTQRAKSYLSDVWRTSLDVADNKSIRNLIIQSYMK